MRIPARLTLMTPINLYRKDGDRAVWERAERDAQAAGLSLSDSVVAALRAQQEQRLPGADVAPVPAYTYPRPLRVGDRVTYTYPEDWRWERTSNGPGTITAAHEGLAYDGPRRTTTGRPCTSYTVAFDDGTTKRYAYIHGRRRCLALEDDGCDCPALKPGHTVGDHEALQEAYANSGDA